MDRRQLRARAFMLKFGYAIRETPGLPSEQQLRERLLLLLEEFFELLREACSDAASLERLQKVEKEASGVISAAPLAMPMLRLLRELGDLAIVIDGTFEAFGVNADRLLAEIHGANMSKQPGGWKPTKPPGWKSPDLERARAKQPAGQDLFWVEEDEVPLAGFEDFSEAKEVANLLAKACGFRRRLRVVRRGLASPNGEEEKSMTMTSDVFYVQLQMQADPIVLAAIERRRDILTKDEGEAILAQVKQQMDRLKEEE